MNPWEERFPRLWAFGERVGVLVIGGLLFYLASAFLVTLPGALAGLFAAVASFVRPVQGEPIGRFWRGLKRQFGTALALGLINLIIAIAVWFYFTWLSSVGTLPAGVGAYLFILIGVFAAMVNTYAWPLLAWYPQPLLKLLRRSALLTAAHPFHALGGPASVAGVGALLWLLPGPVKSLAVLFGPALVAVGTSLAAWKAMKRYAGPDDEFAE